MKILKRKRQQLYNYAQYQSRESDKEGSEESDKEGSEESDKESSEGIINR